MLYKKIFFLLLFISISFLGMDRPVIESKQKQAELAQKRLDLGLIHAVKTGNKNKVKLWLSNGANLLSLDEESGKTAFQIANELGNDEIINLFYIHLHPLKQLPLEIATMARRYVEDDVARARTIKEAVENSKVYLDKNPELIGHLIKKKFGQNALDQELLHVVHTHLYDYILALVKIGVHVNVRSSGFSTTPLLTAMKRNPNLYLIKILIDVGADLNVTDDYGFTPLMYATTYMAEHGIKLVKLLLAGSADPFFKSKIFDKTFAMTAREFAQHQLNYRNVKNNPQKIKILNEMIQILEDAEALQEAVKEQKPEFKPKI